MRVLVRGMVDKNPKWAFYLKILGACIIGGGTGSLVTGSWASSLSERDIVITLCVLSSVTISVFTISIVRSIIRLMKMSQTTHTRYQGQGM